MESVKIILIGSQGVGKTNLISQFVKQQFQQETAQTIGVSCVTKSLDWENRRIKLCLWDTAGQERFRAITSQYYQNTDLCIVVFDMQSQQSLEDCTFWLDSYKKIRDAPVILVGNKSDAGREVVGGNFASKHGLKYFEVSAKTGENVAEMFQGAVEAACGDRRAERKQVIDEFQIIPDKKCC